MKKESTRLMAGMALLLASQLAHAQLVIDRCSRRLSIQGFHPRPIGRRSSGRQWQQQPDHSGVQKLNYTFLISQKQLIMNSTYKNILAIAAILIGFQSVSVAQVKIGNNPANIAAGSALEIESTDKGLRMPQVALTSTTTFAPIAGVGSDASSMGMHVFNTSSAITSGIASNGKAYPAAGIGEYYWDGFGWVTSSVQSGSGGFSLVWAGYSPGPFNYVNNLPGSDLNATETFDTFNANTGGVFTVPVDGYYTIAQNFMVDLVGSGAGNFNSSIVITSFSTGVPESRISNNTGSVNGNRTYSLGNNLTVKLFTGDLVKFTVQPCNGCSGSNYRVRLVSQTIGLFQ